MGIENAKEGMFLYHLTKVDNYESIVRNGMVARNVLIRNNANFKDVADVEIIKKRALMKLDDYIPFHFHPYSAFDVAVKNKYGAKRMMYMCVYRNLARQKKFKILPRHPLSNSRFDLFEYDDGFNEIDWGILQDKNRADNYAKEVKMAECLYEGVLKIGDFAQIYVPSEEVGREIDDIMNKYGIVFNRPRITVQEVWFKGYD